MRLMLLACAASLLFASQVAAQQIELLDTPPDRRAPRGLPGERAPTEQLFIAPSGEPFRAGLGAPYPVAAWFARADADHDGRLTLREFTDDSLLFFKQLDVNNDGVVDGFEGQAYEKEIAPELAAQRDDFGMRAPTRSGGGLFRRGKIQIDPEGAALYGLLNEPQPVAGSDGDLDRRISLAEATSAAARRFRRLDTDNDGVLRLETLPTTQAQQRALERALDGARPGRPPRR